MTLASKKNSPSRSAAGSSPTAYESFLQSPSKKQWERIGTRRRAGAAAALFSVYSQKSVGIGEIPDLELLIGWCLKTGMTILQLLPLNDAGFGFRPYDAHSTFALEPMYLSLETLAGVRAERYQKQIQTLRRQFPLPKPRIDYGIKKAKLDLLWEIFLNEEDHLPQRFQDYVRTNNSWLKDYAAFKVIKEQFQEQAWESWEAPLRGRDRQALQDFERRHAGRIEFQKWLQWQLFEQMTAVKSSARKKGVLLLGDLPFLVSRDSADVWSYQDYFKLELSAGAPPDMYFANGQRWGMPPYRWETIETHGFDYLIQKLKYAEHFYDLFRIDHFVGIFRVWTIPLSEPLENGGRNGVFDPPEESRWEGQGRKILSVMLEHSGMLPCAEDLGTVPACSFRTLEAFAVPGMDVQRWTRDWGKSYDFSPPEAYRKHSAAVIATHDSASLAGWWEFEAGTVDELLFRRKCESRGISFDAVKERLFDAARSCYGRLRWRGEIKDAGILAGILGRPESDLADFIDLYKGSVDEKEKFLAYTGVSAPCEGKMPDALIEAALRKASETASVFSVQMLQDWLAFAGVNPSENAWDFRINFPGTLSSKNWTILMPLSLEAMSRLDINHRLSALHQETGRS